jgi:UDP-GlcNAc:undecaprenyl-phosphate GlcNAc-1-phosphate transferase
MMTLGTDCWVLLAASATTTVATWGARVLALRVGFVSQPNPLIPQHLRPVPYLGGVGLLVGACITLGLLAVLRRLGWFPWGLVPDVRLTLLIPAVMFLLVGLLDDCRPMPPRVKLFYQVLVAAIAVQMDVAPPLMHIAPVDQLLALLWIVVLVNAVNVTDVCDGLVAGLAAVTFLCLAGVDAPHATATLVWCGACVGCLVFNRPPARIFLGDAGSHLLGYLMAIGTLRVGCRAPAWPWVGVMVLLVGVFLFEMVFVTAVRISKRLPWWRGSPDHFAVRLQLAGLSKNKTVGVAWAGAAVLSGAGLALTTASPAGQALILASLVALLVLSSHLLLRVEVPRP